MSTPSRIGWSSASSPPPPGGSGGEAIRHLGGDGGSGGEGRKPQSFRTGIVPTTIPVGIAIASDPHLTPARRPVAIPPDPPPPPGGWGGILAPHRGDGGGSAPPVVPGGAFRKSAGRTATRFRPSASTPRLHTGGRHAWDRRVGVRKHPNPDDPRDRPPCASVRRGLVDQQTEEARTRRLPHWWR